MTGQTSHSMALAETRALGQGSVSGILAALMALTSDAVFIFDGSLQVLSVNAQAEQLSGFSRAELVGKAMTELLFEPSRDTPLMPGSVSALALAPDGALQVLALRLATGGSMQVVIRCDRVSAPGETYLATVKPFEVPSELEQEHDRLVDELALANRRLSGTLKIVLDTIDVADVESLFSEVLEQLALTLDASGALLFIAESKGYRLHSVTRSLEGRVVPQFMGYGEGLESVVAHVGSSLRLRLAAPDEKSLRGGALRTRELIDEETGRTYRIPARHTPPFMSLLCVPVWFADHVIAIIEVGWSEARPVRKDDARLMDSVAQYLSVEFAAALSTMRTERTQKLDHMATQLHRELENSANLSEGDLGLVAEALARDLDVTICPIRSGARGPSGTVGNSATTIINLPTGENKPLALDFIGAAPLADEPMPAGSISFPFSIDELVRGKIDQNIAVVPIGAASPELAQWLADKGCSSSGVILDLGTIADVRRCSLLLRPADAEPVTDVELDFLRRIAIDIHEIAQIREERTKDTRISQALQSGMKNELQKVDGITAEGLYSSATAAALVGGDFYDLIALPNKRACVILGDVSGKGVEAASVSAAVKTALGAYAWEGQTPARMVRLLNDFLLGFSRLETFATLFVGMIDLAHGQLTYCSAGHPPAIYIHEDTHEIQTLDEQSGVVGAFKGMTYHDGHVNIKAGDGLLLYTDGVTEARNPSGAFFAETGLHDAVMEELDRGIEGLTGRLLIHLDTFTERSLEDDVAMVALRFDKVGKGK